MDEANVIMYSFLPVCIQVKIIAENEEALEHAKEGYFAALQGISMCHTIVLKSVATI